ncbi:hypothetical protein Desal_2364 [Maridesulfovibrio salexigens DSM 2638]|uniref:Uncharacterized protein n=2 Tax=Maridesulfovibrio salexigens TaxID=880 RepID=C6BXB4_MARSD|nr:hypothetical protein Desal_2364 [Maridesulfovibrio salexigens DSM 2638]
MASSIIKNKRDLSEASELYNQTKTIWNTISNIGPFSSKNLNGYNTVKTAEELGEYLSFVNERRTLFEPHAENPASKLYEDLKDEIPKLSNANQSLEIIKIGTRIYWEIDKFKALVKEIKDQKNETID